METRLEAFEFALFLILWIATFVLSPIWGWRMRKKFLTLDSRRKERFLVAHFVVLGVGAPVLFSKWSFRGLILDAFVLSAGYIAYGNLVFLFSTLRPKLVGWAMTAIAMLPTAFGLFAGATLLGLMFIIGDILPRQEGQLSSNYFYRISWYGGAYTSEGGANLKIFYRPTLLPFLEEEIFNKEYRDSEYAFQTLRVRLSDNKTQIIAECQRGKNGGLDIATVKAR